MADNDLLTGFINTLKQKGQQTLNSESVQWFQNKIAELARTSQLRVEEVIDKVVGLPPHGVPDTQPTDISSVQIGDTRMKIPTKAIMGQISSITLINIGQMLFYQYDAKLKNKLPYWDAFPIVFPIAYRGDNFLGLNLHYLPPYERSQLLNTLMNLIASPELNETTKLNITYGILKGASTYRFYKPCLKEYLIGHIQSQIFIIKPEEWSSIIMLPLARFQKENQYAVWRNSVKQIYKQPALKNKET